MSPMAWTGLLIGIVFGFALQRGRFCMNSAFRDIIVMKEYTLLKTVGLAIAVEMIGFAILVATGVIAGVNPKPLFWGANIVGSFLFGMGMVLAGGCASGVTYRVGEGMVGAMVAVLGYATFGFITATGKVAGFLSEWKGFLQSSTKIMDGEASLSVHGLLGIPYPVVAAVIGILIIVSLFIWGKEDSEKAEGSLSDKIFKKGWPWVATAVVIGLIGVASFPASLSAGRNYPLGITGGWIGIWKSIFLPDTPLSWEAMEIIGIIIGAAIAAVVAGEFKLRVPEPKVLLQVFFGGALMGFGAVTSSGCNIGHVLSGVPQLSIGSFLATISIILGCWFMAWLIFVRPMNAD